MCNVAVLKPNNWLIGHSGAERKRERHFQLGESSRDAVEDLNQDQTEAKEDREIGMENLLGVEATSSFFKD